MNATKKGFITLSGNIHLDKNPPVSKGANMEPKDVILSIAGLLLANQLINQQESSIPLGYTPYIHALIGIDPEINNNGQEVLEMCFKSEGIITEDNSYRVASELYFKLIVYKYYDSGELDSVDQ